MEFARTDCESVYAQLKRQNKDRIRKRRWLLGLPISKYEKKRFKGPRFLNDRSLSESLLREDDVFHETVKTHIETCFGVLNAGGIHTVQEHIKPVDLSNAIRILLSFLDDMTTKGQYRLSKILTSGSMKFDKTRSQMKKLIRNYLPEVLRKENHSQTEISTKLSQFLKNSRNFKPNNRFLSSPSPRFHHTAATKLLDGLEDMNIQTLTAMYRKLKAVKGYIPQLQTHKNGWSRDRLINRVRKMCVEMLQKLGEGDKLQERLAKAMAVAALSLKVRKIDQHPAATEFYQFTSEIESLQNEITKAIWFLEPKQEVRAPELKTLRLLLEPDTKLSSSHLKTAIKKVLTEYLFECSEMDTIPNSLLKALSIINSRRSPSGPQKCFPKELIEEEVERVLSVSAQAKQILWDLIPDLELDRDFANAYVEDLVDSDDCDDDKGLHEPKSITSHSNDLHNALERVEDSEVILSDQISVPLSLDSSLSSPYTVYSSSQITTAHGSGFAASLFSAKPELNEDSFVTPQPKGNPKADSPHLPNIFSSNIKSEDEKVIHDRQSTSRNHYLLIQEVCDETSLVAYNLVGHLLGEFAQVQGLILDQSDESYLKSQVPWKSKDQTSSGEDVDDSIFVQVVKKIVPSFPKSGIEKLKELMDFQ